MPDGIDAAVYAEEPARGDAPPDRFVAEARVEELQERDHAVLTRGQCRDHSVRIGGCAE